MTDKILQKDGTFLMDGEIYLEENEYVYSMFDCLIWDSKVALSYSLERRLNCCKEIERYSRKGLVLRKNDSKYPRFDFLAKVMYKAYHYNEILNDIKNLKHDNDGLIFTPVNLPYNLGVRSDILKWKPPHLNTIDFFIKKTNFQTVYKLCCPITKQQIKSVENITSADSMVDFDFYYSTTENEKLHDKIGEFVFDSSLEVLDLSDFTIKMGGWVLHRIREDKDAANNIKIVMNTFESILNTITQEELITYKQKIRENWIGRAEALNSEKNVLKKMIH
jgi:mRNA guanylyltransferase